MRRAWLVVALGFAASACNCEARAVGQRVEELATRGDAEREGLELAEIDPAYASGLGADDARLFVGLGRASVDESAAIRASLERPEVDALPEVPAELVVLAELDEGRLPTGATRDAIATRASAITARAGTRTEHWRYGRFALYADRRVPWVTIRRLQEALGAVDVYTWLVVRGPAGPQRLPMLLMMPGVRFCSRAEQPARESPPVPEVVALGEEEEPAYSESGCDYLQAFAVELRDDGQLVTSQRGAITPDCRSVQVGGDPHVTIQRRGAGYDYTALSECLRRLRELYPNERNVELLVSGELATVEDYVRTWHAARGSPDDPIFGDVF